MDLYVTFKRIKTIECKEPEISCLHLLGPMTWEDKEMNDHSFDLLH